jgi:hypothetical protein
MKLHQQDEDDYCGSAVAQMMLAAANADISDQDRLYGLMTTLYWNTEPEMLAKQLNQRDSLTRYQVYRDQDATTAYGRLAAATKSGLAVAAVVHRGVHWVMICSVTTDSSNPPRLTHVTFNDPFPDTASQLGEAAKPPPPHDDTDLCGSGAPFGYADALETTAGWALYWPVPPQPPTTPTKPSADTAPYVIVGPIGLKPVSIADVEFKLRRRSRSVASAAQVDAACNDVAGLLDERRALECAERGLAEYQLDRSLANEYSAASRPPSARLVRYDDQAYYLVTLERRGAPAMVRVRAHDGVFLGVITGSAIHDLPPRDDLRVRRALVADATRLHGIVTPTDIETQPFTVAAALLWRPCRQSKSPYFPFAQITIAGTTLFLSCNGRIYPRLDGGIHA